MKKSILPHGSGATCHGYTIVELLIAIVVALAVIGAVYSFYSVHRRQSNNQRQLVITRQNLRAAMLVIEQELRKVGYDPEDSGRFGLVDIRRYSVINKGELDNHGQPVLSYTWDENEDGALDGTNGGRNREHPIFAISDIHKDGRICLSWDNGSGRRPLAENIHAIGYAFAIDSDADGRIDRWKGGDHTIWAIDSDNDNLLDTHIDANDDGRIDVQDDINGDGRIDDADGGALNAQVSLKCVKAARVWVLAMTPQSLQGRGAAQPIQVGDRILPAPSNGKVCMVLEAQVACRNL